MTIDTEKYVRKPLYVDAVRITPVNFDEIARWCQGTQEYDSETNKKYIHVRVHNPKNVRQSKAYVGDWLLYTERGYKVYTSKPFFASFDRVGADTVGTEAERLPQLPKFYIDPNTGSLTEKTLGKHTKPLELNELINIIRNELVDEKIEVSYKVYTSKPFATDLEEGPASVHKEQIAFVQATPQPIAGGVLENATVHDERTGKVFTPSPSDPIPMGSPVVTVEEVPNQETVEPTAVEGKHVLSVEEQRSLTADEIKEMVQSGKAVLVQDIAQ